MCSTHHLIQDFLDNFIIVHGNFVPTFESFQSHLTAHNALRIQMQHNTFDERDIRRAMEFDLDTISKKHICAHFYLDSWHPEDYPHCEYIAWGLKRKIFGEEQISKIQISETELEDFVVSYLPDISRLEATIHKQPTQEDYF